MKCVAPPHTLSYNAVYQEGVDNISFVPRKVCKIHVQAVQVHVVPCFGHGAALHARLLQTPPHTLSYYALYQEGVYNVRFVRGKVCTKDVQAV